MSSVKIGIGNTVNSYVRKLTLRLPNYIPSVIRVILVAGKVFTHNCATG
jgi:hypothetical protein